MNLTRIQIKDLTLVLRALSGPADKPYQYDEKTRYAIAKNLVLLSRHVGEMEKHRVAAVKALLADGQNELVPDSPEHKAFVDQMVQYRTESVEIPNLMMIDMNALVKAGTAFDLIENLDPVLTGVE